ncbi:substrate-binding domain-containing protein [Nitratireductor aquimarinus]|uniref:Substrate-binding domain-containing protein n=1 Tax=Nitratireductor aquimarinus TaxID=889300 RepID=A0ABU4AGJ4_9HYPH|nr:MULTISPECIES: substrate-binding domain-containing protein [Nitratireductor]MCA1301143.1 substrate-binding domain-containing protein [Nitratireductor aquimarinus]MDV6225350.1 substrate-binding domain-containing protein [Nitratireductor aquimarinus]
MATRKAMNLKMLSEALGLSQTTVSRALNGFPEVAEKTRARVVEAAERLNYRPSPSAASLATGKSRMIGHVVSLSEHIMINPHFADFIAGAGEIYAQSGYDILLRLAPLEEQERIYLNLAEDQRVDGVVVHGPLTGDSRIGILNALGMPFVVHGRCDEEGADYCWMDVNNRRAFHRAAKFLLDLGHERIALINGLETMNFAERRRQGYEAALAEAGVALDERLLHSADMVEPYGYQATRALMELDEPPTAILVASVLPAMGVTRALVDLGLRAGEDVSVIAFDDCLSFLQSGYKGSAPDIPYFTAVRSSIREAGKRVAQLLLERIETPDGPPLSELWEADFVIGQTTAPPRRR